MSLTFEQALTQALEKLEKMSESPQLDAELLLAHVTKKTREYILSHPEKVLLGKQKISFDKFIIRRTQLEPIAYITKHKEFYGLDFEVTQNTLIPRPETEHLVEISLKEISTIKKFATLLVLDIGTGSGNIIISLARNIKNKIKNKIKFFGIDISEKTLDVAKQNARKNKVANKIKFIKSNLLNYFLRDKNNLLKIKNTKLIIVSNLPYLSQEIYSQTLPNVKKFEPASALLSGRHGLDHYKKLLDQIERLKEKYPALRLTCYMEFSPEQRTRLQKIIKGYFPESQVEFQKDLRNKWRVASFSI